MWDAPMVLTSALLLGLVAMLVMVRRRFSLRSRLVGGVLLLAAVMCSGTGLVAAVTVGCFVLLRVGVRSAVVVGAPAVIAFSVWFFTIGRDGRVNVSGSRVTDIPVFVWKGLTGSLGSLVGIPGTGALLLLALVAVLLWPFLEAIALRQLALAGIDRGRHPALPVGVRQPGRRHRIAARVGRYEYLVLVLLAASIALALETAARARRTRAASRQGCGPPCRWSACSCSSRPPCRAPRKSAGRRTSERRTRRSTAPGSTARSWPPTPVRSS